MLRLMWMIRPATGISTYLWLATTLAEGFYDVDVVSTDAAEIAVNKFPFGATGVALTSRNDLLVDLI